MISFRHALLASTVFASLSASTALAQSPTQLTATPASPAPAASDPNIDRGFILPTAMTQPKGTVTYNNYELLLHGVTYGVTDNVQSSLTVVSPIVRGMPFFGLASTKARFSPASRAHLALQGTLGFMHVLNDGESGTLYSLGAGAYASFCLRSDCSSLVSGSVSYSYLTTGGPDTGYLLVYGGSVVHAVSDRVKLLAEVTSAGGGQNAAGDLKTVDGFLLSYGLRFHGTTFASDVGFMKPFDTSGGTGDFLLGLPFVSVSYRWE